MELLEFKQLVYNTLGNNIRCILPSFWWKKFFSYILDKLEFLDNYVQKVSAKPSELRVTYEELYDLVLLSKLNKGWKYIITDYETITCQIGTKSAGILFDVVVTAIDDHTLSENAEVRVSNRTNEDTELVKLFSSMDKWKIKYSLKNDLKYPWCGHGKKVIRIANDDGTYSLALYQRAFNMGSISKYAWSPLDVGWFNTTFLTDSDNPQIGDFVVSYRGGSFDGEPILYDIGTVDITFFSDLPGKGVITHMVDEFNNECFYDFKNIQFLMYGETINSNGICDVVSSIKDSKYKNEMYLYTFTDYNSGGYIDQSSCSLLGSGCRNNRIGKSIGLPHVVLYSYYNSTDCGYNNIIVGDNCYNLLLYGNNLNVGGYCRNVSLIDEAGYNSSYLENITSKIGNHCHDILININFMNSIIGNNCSYISAYTVKNSEFADCLQGTKESIILLGDLVDEKVFKDSYGNIIIKNKIDSGAISIKSTPSQSVELTPNTYYKCTTSGSSLTITFKEGNSKIINNYMFEFTPSSNSFVLNLPSTVIWANNTPPLIESGKIFQVSIINNLAVFTKF